MVVTVFRQVKRPVVRMTIVAGDPAFEALEANLDWLETTGTLVERFDPRTAPAEMDTRPAVQHLLSLKGSKALPLILVDGAIVSEGVYPTRTQLARAVGRGRIRVRRALVCQLAALGAAAAMGTDDEVRAEAGRARELGLTDEMVRLASEAGAGRRRAAQSNRVA